jgi:hypothetical protein
MFLDSAVPVIARAAQIAANPLALPHTSTVRAVQNAASSSHLPSALND